jgi:hypothetical protein
MVTGRKCATRALCAPLSAFDHASLGAPKAEMAHDNDIWRADLRFMTSHLSI